MAGLIPAAISSRAGAELAFAGVSLVTLVAVWLLVTNASRRGSIADRGAFGPQRQRSLEARLNGWMVRSGRGAGLNERLIAAGSETTAGRFLLICAAAALGGFLVLDLLLGRLLGLVGAALAVWGCLHWLDHRLEQRRELFVGQLPEVARLLSNGASAGLSIPAALEMCVREIEEPARSELQLVLDELWLGRSLDQALESLGDRLPSREVSVLMTTLVIQQRSGGDAVQALHDLAHTLDERRNTLREVGTLLAGAVYTSYLVPLMGVGALLLLNAVDANTLHALTTKPLGIVVLILAAGMYAASWVLIRRTTRIEL